MNFDLSAQPQIVQTIAGYGLQGWEVAKGWLLSPAAWSQFGLLLAAFAASWLLNKRLQPLLEHLLTPEEGKKSILATFRRFLLVFVPLLLPLIAWAFTAIGEQATRALFGSGAVIAFGKRVFLLLAARILVREIITDGFLRVLG